MYFNYKGLEWLEDYKGTDFGFNDISVVSLYKLPETNIIMLVDTDEHELLKAWLKLSDRPNYLEYENSDLELLKQYLRDLKVLYDKL